MFWWHHWFSWSFYWRLLDNKGTLDSNGNESNNQEIEPMGQIKFHFILCQNAFLWVPYYNFASCIKEVHLKRRSSVQFTRPTILRPLWLSWRARSCMHTHYYIKRKKTTTRFKVIVLQALPDILHYNCYSKVAFLETDWDLECSKLPFNSKNGGKDTYWKTS